jgi:hypothetical protein
MGCGSSFQRPRDDIDQVEVEALQRRLSSSSNMNLVEMSNNGKSTNSKVTILDPHVSLDRKGGLSKPNSNTINNASNANRPLPDVKEKKPTEKKQDNSSNQQNTVNTNTSSSNTSSLPTSPKNIYKAIKIGTLLMCRDSFHSKYSGQLKYKWREAEIVDLDPENPQRIFIHFVGWNPSFDIWVDIEEEIFKIAPVGLLSKNEVDTGAALDHAQLQLVKYFLLTGHCLSNNNSGQNSGHNSATSSVVDESNGINNHHNHNSNSTSNSNATSVTGAGSAPLITKKKSEFKPVLTTIASADQSEKTKSSGVSANSDKNGNTTTSSTQSPNQGSRQYTFEKTYDTDQIRPPPSYDVGQPVSNSLLLACDFSYLVFSFAFSFPCFFLSCFLPFLLSSFVPLI